MSESADLTYYQKDMGDVVLNRARDYYENDKEKLRKQAKNKYRNLSEEEKNKKENILKIDITICLKKKKIRLKEYQEKYREAKKI